MAARRFLGLYCGFVCFWAHGLERHVMKPESRKRLGLALAAVFALSMIMGTGPGVLLVNRPKPCSACSWPAG